MNHGLIQSKLVRPPKNLREMGPMQNALTPIPTGTGLQVKEAHRWSMGNVNISLVIEASVLSETQDQQRTMQFSYFVNEIHMVDAFPYVADRFTESPSTFSMMINSDSISVDWACELQVKTFEIDIPKLRKSMVASCNFACCSEVDHWWEWEL